jgi:methylenetetrahydrofolate reductase (NADPH)
MFYVNAHYFAFVERLRRAGIGVPVVAGAHAHHQPGADAAMAELCGAEFPEPLRQRLEQLAGDPAGSLASGSSG